MKNKFLILMFSFLMLFAGISQASAASNSVTINGYKIKVAPGPIVMNGKKISSDISSFIYDSRTLVHIRFIEENSDAKVSWDNPSKTVTIDHNGKKIKLAIDYGIATIDGVEKELDSGSIPRLAKFDGEKNSKTMVPLSFLSEAMGFEVGWDSKNKSAYVNSKTFKKTEVAKNPVADNTNKITDIKKETVDKKDAIVIYGTKDVKWNIMQFKDPGRIVVDLMDSTIQFGVENEYDYDLSFIKGIRVSQFSPDKNYKPDDKITRLVLDIKDGVNDFDIQVNSSNKKIIIFPIKKLGAVTDSQAELASIDNTDVEILASALSLETSANVIPVNFMAKDRLVVIDPGHGGAQPGAISPNGIKEKDVNLEISLKLQAALKNAGYNVLMTREGDTTLDNYERANFANRNLASLFLSIHANSAENFSAKGIEVLYAPAPKSTFKENGQKLFTESIIEEVSRSTGAKARGIIERPKLVVVRETKMPSLLLEVGFLSNPEEERLVTNSDYQNKIVSGITSGINKYFDSN